MDSTEDDELPTLEHGDTATADHLPPTAEEETYSDPQWYKDVPDEPDLLHTTSLDLCREACQEWGLMAGLKLVQKSADLKVGKATFVCGCKGRKARAGAGNDSLEASKRRAKSVQYALPGEDRCPFRYDRSITGTQAAYCWRQRLISYVCPSSYQVECPPGQVFRPLEVHENRQRTQPRPHFRDHT